MLRPSQLISLLIGILMSKSVYLLGVSSEPIGVEKFECRTTGLFPHSEDCSSFYECVKQGEPPVNILKCPSNTQFDTVEKVCKPLASANCILCKKDGFFKDSRSSYHYFECSDGVAERIKCKPSGAIFNSELQTCDILVDKEAIYTKELLSEANLLDVVPPLENLNTDSQQDNFSQGLWKVWEKVKSRPAQPKRVESIDGSSGQQDGFAYSQASGKKIKNIAQAVPTKGISTNQAPSSVKYESTAMVIPKGEETDVEIGSDGNSVGMPSSLNDAELPITAYELFQRMAEARHSLQKRKTVDGEGKQPSLVAGKATLGAGAAANASAGAAAAQPRAGPSGAAAGKAGVGLNVGFGVNLGGAGFNIGGGANFGAAGNAAGDAAASNGAQGGSAAKADAAAAANGGVNGGSAAKADAAAAANGGVKGGSTAKADAAAAANGGVKGGSTAKADAAAAANGGVKGGSSAKADAAAAANSGVKGGSTAKADAAAAANGGVQGGSKVKALAAANANAGVQGGSAAKAEAAAAANAGVQGGSKVKAEAVANANAGVHGGSAAKPGPAATTKKPYRRYGIIHFRVPCKNPKQAAAKNGRGLPIPQKTTTTVKTTPAALLGVSTTVVLPREILESQNTTTRPIFKGRGILIQTGNGTDKKPPSLPEIEVEENRVDGANHTDDPARVLKLKKTVTGDDIDENVRIHGSWMDGGDYSLPLKRPLETNLSDIIDATATERIYIMKRNETPQVVDHLVKINKGSKDPSLQKLNQAIEDEDNITASIDGKEDHLEIFITDGHMTLSKKNQSQIARYWGPMTITNVTKSGERVPIADVDEHVGQAHSSGGNGPNSDEPESSQNLVKVVISDIHGSRRRKQYELKKGGYDRGRWASSLAIAGSTSITGKKSGSVAGANAQSADPNSRTRAEATGMVWEGGAEAVASNSADSKDVHGAKQVCLNPPCKSKNASVDIFAYKIGDEKEPNSEPALVKNQIKNVEINISSGGKQDPKASETRTKEKQTEVKAGEEVLGKPQALHSLTKDATSGRIQELPQSDLLIATHRKQHLHSKPNSVVGEAVPIQRNEQQGLRKIRHRKNGTGDAVEQKDLFAFDWSKDSQNTNSETASIFPFDTDIDNVEKENFGSNQTWKTGQEQEGHLLPPVSYEKHFGNANSTAFKKAVTTNTKGNTSFSVGKSVNTDTVQKYVREKELGSKKSLESQQEVKDEAIAGSSRLEDGSARSYFDDKHHNYAKTNVSEQNKQTGETYDLKHEKQMDEKNASDTKTGKDGATSVKSTNIGKGFEKKNSTYTADDLNERESLDRQIDAEKHSVLERNATSERRSESDKLVKAGTSAKFVNDSGIEEHIAKGQTLSKDIQVDTAKDGMQDERSFTTNNSYATDTNSYKNKSGEVEQSKSQMKVRGSEGTKILTKTNETKLLDESTSLIASDTTSVANKTKEKEFLANVQNSLSKHEGRQGNEENLGNNMTRSKFLSDKDEDTQQKVIFVERQNSADGTPETEKIRQSTKTKLEWSKSSLDKVEDPNNNQTTKDGSQDGNTTYSHTSSDKLNILSEEGKKREKAAVSQLKQRNGSETGSSEADSGEDGTLPSKPQASSSNISLIAPPYKMKPAVGTSENKIGTSPPAKSGSSDDNVEPPEEGSERTKSPDDSRTRGTKTITSYSGGGYKDGEATAIAASHTKGDASEGAALAAAGNGGAKAVVTLNKLNI